MAKLCKLTKNPIVVPQQEDCTVCESHLNEAVTEQPLKGNVRGGYLQVVKLWAMLVFFFTLYCVSPFS